MGSSKKERLRQWLENQRPPQITEAHFAELRERLSPVTDGYLRRLLRASGAALSPVVEGVVQDSFDDLERTLRALSEEYENSDRVRAKSIRGIVIQAKDHARWAALRSPEKAPIKTEMVTWLLVWLENPAVFPLWVGLRRPRNPVSAPWRL
jgi:hypothetical protein